MPTRFSFPAYSYKFMFYEFRCHSSFFDSYSLIILCIEEWFYLFFFNTSLTAVNLAKTVFFNGDIGKRYTFYFFFQSSKK